MFNSNLRPTAQAQILLLLMRLASSTLSVNRAITEAGGRAYQKIDTEEPLGHTAAVTWEGLNYEKLFHLNGPPDHGIIISCNHLIPAHSPPHGEDGTSPISNRNLQSKTIWMDLCPC